MTVDLMRVMLSLAPLKILLEFLAVRSILGTGITWNVSAWDMTGSINAV